jgi:hypothetical protein
LPAFGNGYVLASVLAASTNGFTLSPSTASLGLGVSTTSSLVKLDMQVAISVPSVPLQGLRSSVINAYTGSSVMTYGINSSTTNSGSTGTNYGIYSYAYSNNSSSTVSTYGLYSNASKSGTSGTVYGVYSSVTGGERRYAGYFTGGDVSANNGNLFVTNGKLGVGTANPLANFHNNSGANNSYAAILATSAEDNKLVVSSFTTQPVNGKVFSIMHEFGNSQATDYRDNGFINFYRGGSYGGGFLTFGSSGQERMRIASNGNVGIGTANPQYMLDVNGIIRAREVLVNLNDGADFVFEDDYELMNLTELGEFVKTNRHLPEIPSAQEMTNGATNMGELQVKLLQKIEELTLYTIQQNEKIIELENKINNLNNGGK